jgi:hypothetical protein
MADSMRQFTRRGPDPRPLPDACRTRFPRVRLDPSPSPARRSAFKTQGSEGQVTGLCDRAAMDTCPVCFWEDDGQDDPHADELWGGPTRDSASQSPARSTADSGPAKNGVFLTFARRHPTRDPHSQLGYRGTGRHGQRDRSVAADALLKLGAALGFAAGC